MDTIEKNPGFSIRGTIKSQENGGWTNMRAMMELTIINAGDT